MQDSGHLTAGTITLGALLEEIRGDLQAFIDTTPNSNPDQEQALVQARAILSALLTPSVQPIPLIIRLNPFATQAKKQGNSLSTETFAALCSSIEEICPLQGPASLALGQRSLALLKSLHDLEIRYAPTSAASKNVIAESNSAHYKKAKSQVINGIIDFHQSSLTFHKNTLGTPLETVRESIKKMQDDFATLSNLFRKDIVLVKHLTQKIRELETPLRVLETKPSELSPSFFPSGGYRERSPRQTPHNPLVSISPAIINKAQFQATPSNHASVKGELSHSEALSSPPRAKRDPKTFRP